MKRLLFLLFISTVIISACGKKTVATKDIPVNISTETPPAENPRLITEVIDASLLAAGKVI